MSAKNRESVNKFIRRKSDRKMKFISWYYKLTESAILNYIKMPSTPYDLVRDDQDLRIPLHAEQAFFNGIPFQAKVSHLHSLTHKSNNRIIIYRENSLYKFELNIPSTNQLLITFRKNNCFQFTFRPHIRVLDQTKQHK